MVRVSHWSFRKQMLSLIGLGALAFVGLASVAGISFLRTSIGGSLYEDVVAGKALETDVVPPPLFQAEPYLLCYQASRELDPWVRDTMLARLDSLKVGYEERAALWRDADFPDSIRQVIESTLVTSDSFWYSVDSGFRPAMANVDVIAASNVVDRPLRERFRMHRRSALRLAGLAEDYARKAESSALGSRMAMMSCTALVALVGILLMGATFRLASTLIRRIDVQRAASEHSDARTLVVDEKGVIVWESPASARNRSGLSAFVDIPERGVVGISVHLLHPVVDGLGDVLSRDLSCRVPRREPGILSGQAEDIVLVFASRVRRDAAGRSEGAVLTWEVQDARFDAERRSELARQLDERASEMEGSVSLLEQVGLAGVEQSNATRERCASIRSSSSELEASIRSIAGSTEEMAASVQEMAKVSNLAMIRATESHAEASSTMVFLTKLHEEGARISEAVGLIDTLAAQTRLLALNATIEAARAGEAGRGFAVVAQEVKDLSKTTAEANSRIASVVRAMLQGLQDAAGGIERISRAALEASDLQRTLASGVEEQSATTREVARAVSLSAEQGTAMRSSLESLEVLAVEGAEHARRTASTADALRSVSTDLSIHVRHLRDLPEEA